ncbi:MAG: carotenoid biosynthesis protein, partial [Verrucomicrobiaceae bacterium]
PLAGSLWIFFLVLSVIIAPIWAFDLGEAQIRTSLRGKELQTALLWLSHILDITWVTVAAAIVYSESVRAVGIATARRWALVVLAVSWVAAAASVRSGWPVGFLHFTGRLGFLLGSVSFGWLLLWCVVVLGGRELALTVFPRASHAAISVLVGSLAGLTDLSLEPLASKTRAWWLFLEKSPAIPLPGPIQSALSWFLIATVLGWTMRGPTVVKRPASGLPKSAQVFLILHILLLAAHLGRTLRS